MTVGCLTPRKRSAFVGLHMGAQSSPRQRLGHGRQVVLEIGGIDEQGRRREILDPHHEECDTGTSFTYTSMEPALPIPR